jgi:hypothetical protein
METSTQLFRIVEDGAVFEPRNHVHYAGRYMNIETSTDDEDGTYPEVKDYIELIDKMDADGTDAWLNWCSSGNALDIDLGYCRVVRDTEYAVEARLEFPEPIKMKVAEVNGEPVLVDVDTIEGEFTHEWFFTKSGRQDEKANGFDIYFDCKKLFLKGRQRRYLMSAAPSIEMDMPVNEIQNRLGADSVKLLQNSQIAQVDICGNDDGFRALENEMGWVELFIEHSGEIFTVRFNNTRA